MRRARPEGTSHVPLPLLPVESALRPKRARPLEQRLDLQAPPTTELPGEATRWVMPPLEAPVAVRGHERDQLRLRRYRDDLVDDRGGARGEVAEPPFLPGGDDCTNANVVLDRRAGGGERDPTACALAAARHRPRGRRPAARAGGCSDPRQRTRARGAKGGARNRTDDAPSGKEHVQQHMHSRYAGRAHASVPRVRQNMYRQAVATPPPQPPPKKSFRWGRNDPDHPLESWWGGWLRRGTPKRWRPPGPPTPPPGQRPPAA
jgi:hypothetical protein